MTDLAREYGEGLYALAAEEHAEKDWLEQLSMLKAVFHDQPDFIRLLGNLSLTREERLSVMDSVLRGRVHPFVQNFLKLLCERGALSQFSGCEAAYRAMYNQTHQVVQAVVTTSAALTADQHARMQARLQQMTGKEVSLTERIDPTIIGGVVLEMDGKRYDNSVTHRLQQIHQAISGQ